MNTIQHYPESKTTPPRGVRSESGLPADCCLVVPLCFVILPIGGLVVKQSYGIEPEERHGRAPFNERRVRTR